MSFSSLNCLTATSFLFFFNLYIALNCKHLSSFFSDEECGDCIDADKRPHKIARWQALKENS